MHLGARYITDPRAHERRVCDFLDSITGYASALYILGDALDYWYEYRYVVPRGHVRFFGALARLADSGTAITWITGNHDIWLYDYLRDEIGLEVIDAPMVSRDILGSRFVLAHGDRVGPQKRGFRFISRMFRNRTCQRLYSAINPWYTIPFALGWSRRSRAAGSGDGAAAYRERVGAVLDASCREIMAAYPDTRYIVMGHHHLPLQQPVEGTTAQLTVLGDWTTGSSYAVFDGKALNLINKLLCL